MLVLSRKQGEALQVDSDIRIVVVSLTNGRVKLGIEAPAHVRIMRTELQDWEGSSLEGRHASLLAPDDTHCSTHVNAE